jgi:hypothetical protein
MRELNLGSIGYLAFRLAPFILVSFFVLSSMFRQDIKGLIYVVGLIIAGFCTTAVGNLFPQKFTKTDVDAQLCNVFSLTNTGPISRIPLNLTVLGYTFCYLLYIIMTYNLAIQNMPTIILFIVLIISEFVWAAKHECAGTFPLLISFIVGSSIGILWAYVIDSSKIVKIQYFNGLATSDICSAPARKTFRCQTKQTSKNK